MRLALVALLAVPIAAPPAAAQDADTLTAADGWRQSLVATLAGNQARFVNWQEGGVDALAVSGSLDGQFDRVVGNVLTTQTLRLALGALQQDTLSVRKALDVVRYAAAAEVGADRPLRPAVTASVRSQFAPGFDYAPAAEDYPALPVVAGEPLKVSDAFAPLVLAQTVGVAWRPGGGVVARTGLGLKETVVGIRRLRPVHGNAPDQAVRVEAGLDAELVLERGLMENVVLRSRLATFQGFGQIGEAAPDAVLETVLLLKVNGLLNVTLDGAALYDADVDRRVQLREALSVGVSVGLL